MRSNFTYDGRGLTDALKAYLDLKGNVDPKKEIRRRGKNISMRLIRKFKEAAPTAAEIKSKISSLERGWKVKVRKKIRSSGLPRAEQIKKEVAARVRACTFTATGWFPAATALGGSPKKKKGVNGPERGQIIEKLSSSKVSETLINEQPGAAQTDERAKGALEKAFNEERDDMMQYIQKKLGQGARRNGL